VRLPISFAWTTGDQEFRHEAGICGRAWCWKHRTRPDHSEGRTSLWLSAPLVHIVQIVPLVISLTARGALGGRIDRILVTS
jgi:hypothetical protein